LGEAKNPIICSGGGVLSSGAWVELQQLAETLQAPVIMSRNGRGALSDRHYLGHTSMTGRDLLPKADVILAVGTRFVDPATIWGLSDEQTVIQLDIDAEEIGRNYPNTMAVQADAKAGLAALASRVTQYTTTRPSREAELNAMKDAVRVKLDGAQPQAAWAAAIRRALPDEGIVVNESTQVGYYANVGFPVYQPRTFINSGYQGTLGYGFATALGAKVGNPNTPVVSINGDGGFMYNVQELSTMVAHKINAVAIVFTDNAYGNVKRIQQQSFDNHTIASDLVNPDFVKLAESFGVIGMRADAPEALERSLTEALSMNAPVLIEVPVGEMPGIGPLLGWGNRPSPPAPRR
jgi:acetolactate synthase-1/2/3 large subunit